jgi:Ser/Thr protein kinase RdoA (MazF antagonist)
VEGPLVRARGSQIFRAKSRRDAGAFAVKVFAPRTPQAHILKQAEILRIYRERMSPQSNLTVPALLAVLPRYRTLVMEWIAEPTMREQFATIGGDRRKRAELFRAGGRWLRAYHERADLAILPLDLAALRAEIETNLNESGWTRTDRPTGAFMSSYQVLLDNAGALGDGMLAHARLHGDFHSKNLFHGPDRTVVIDIAAAASGPVTSDICRFLVQTEVSKPFLTRKSTLDPLGIEETDLRAFLDGYDPKRELIQPRPFAYLLLAETLRRWSILFGRSKGPFHAIRQTKHRRLKRIAHYAANALKASS